MFPSWRCKASNGTEGETLGMAVRDTSGLVNGPHQAAAPSVTANVEATNREAFFQQRWGLLITVIYNSALITHAPL